jgi:hypothetical protein
MESSTSQCVPRGSRKCTAASWLYAKGRNGYVAELDEEEESFDEAAGIVHDELSAGMSQIQKAVKRSPVLQALKGGVTGLVTSGISGTTTEVITNDPLLG